MANSVSDFDPVNLIQKLIQIESLSGNEEALVTFLSEFLRSSCDCELSVDGRNIILQSASKNSEKSPSILLCSHIDTVSVCDGWTKNPFGGAVEETASKDLKITGLGANDALASVVSIIYGFLHTHQKLKSGQLKGRLTVAIVCEEEKGNQGFVRIEPTLPRYDFGIFGEPTNLQIGYCMRGSMKLRAFARGKSCHASRPHEGKNAIFELTEVLSRIRSLPLKDDSPWGTATCEPVRIEGGMSENQIPDKVSILLDSRPTWKVNNEKILELLTAADIEYEVIRNIRRAQHCDTDSPFVRAVASALPSASFYPFGGSCDMAFSTSPSIIFGPGSSERSHAADEFILKSELISGCTSYKNLCEAIFENVHA